MISNRKAIGLGMQPKSRCVCVSVCFGGRIFGWLVRGGCVLGEEYLKGW